MDRKGVPANTEELPARKQNAHKENRDNEKFCVRTLEERERKKRRL